MLKTIVVRLVTVALPANIILNHYYSQPLYHLGVQIILLMQQFSTPALDYVFMFFTFLIDPVFIMASCCLFMLFMKRKIVAYSTVIFILFNTFLLTTLKAFYAAPRPYWTHQKVRNIGYYCPKDYGNPSGHSQFVAIVACVFLLQFLDTKRQKRYGLLAIFLMLAVSVSRLYLGAHSLDQVMQGLFMGISLSILYTQGGLKEFIVKLLLSKQKRYRILFTAIIITMHILYTLGYYINHEKQIDHQDVAKVWLANYKQKCGKDIDQDYLNFLMANLSSVLVSGITGLVLGFWKAAQHQNIQFFIGGQWTFNRLRWAPLSYAAYYAVEIALFASGFVVLSPMLIALGKDNVSLLLYNNLGCLASTYLYSSNAYRIHNRFKLIVPLNLDSSKDKAQ